MTYLLLILAGLSKGIMWRIQFHEWVPPFIRGHEDPKFEKRMIVPFFYEEWWDINVSWTNKYEDRDHMKGSAFPLSTTIGVVITDAFHFFQFLFETSWQLALSIYISASLFESSSLNVSQFMQIVAGLLLVKICYSTTFEITFKYLFNMTLEKIKNWFASLFSTAPIVYSVLTLLPLFLLFAGIGSLGKVGVATVVILIGSGFLFLFATLTGLIGKQASMHMNLYAVQEQDLKGRNGAFSALNESKLKRFLRSIYDRIDLTFKEEPLLLIITIVFVLSIVPLSLAKTTDAGPNLAQYIADVMIFSCWLMGMYLIMKKTNAFQRLRQKYLILISDDEPLT